MNIKKLSFLAVLILTGCAAKYNYEPIDKSEPKITLGDRHGGGSWAPPARSFGINISGTDKCSDYESSATLSNNWVGLGENTVDYYVPKGSKVSLIGNYSRSDGTTYTSCSVGPISFQPEPSKHYSIDIEVKHRICRISIVEISPDGTHLETEVEQVKEADCT